MEAIKQVSAWGLPAYFPSLELFLLLLLFLVPTALQGAQSAPDAMLRTVTSDVLASLKQDKDLFDDSARLESLIESKIVPVFDFSLMTQFAMGKNWKQASSGQQNRLTAEFKALLIRSHAGMLASYRDHEITYRPLRFVPGDTDAIVQSEARKPGSKLLKVDYALTRTPGGWKVYDVKLDGISVVTAYRERFAARMRESGVDGLIRSLAEQNRQAVPVTRTSMAGG